MKTISTVLVLLLTASTQASDLEPTTRKLELAWQTLNALDTIETLHAMSRPDLYYEGNPVLGKHPSNAKVVLYMGGSAAIHYAVTKGLSNADAPRWLQRGWQYVSISVSGYCVVANFTTFKRLEK